jgi:hypothetical protein
MTEETLGKSLPSTGKVGSVFGGKLYNNKFDLAVCVMQIVCMQFAFCAGLVFWTLTFDYFYGLRPHIGQLFAPSAFDLTQTYFGPTFISHLLTVPVMVLANAIIVEKANKCLDFTLTVYFYHFLASVCLYGLAGFYQWWII